MPTLQLVVEDELSHLLDLLRRYTATGKWLNVQYLDDTVPAEYAMASEFRYRFTERPISSRHSSLSP